MIPKDKFTVKTVMKIASFLHWYHDGNYYSDIEYEVEKNVLRFTEYRCLPTPDYASLGVVAKFWLRLVKKEGRLQDLFYNKTMEWFFVKEKVRTYSGYLEHCHHGRFEALNINSNKLFAKKEITLGIVCIREFTEQKTTVCKWSDEEKIELIVDLKGGLVLNGAYLKHAEQRKQSK